jgi:hypothetical protein
MSAVLPNKSPILGNMAYEGYGEKTDVVDTACGACKLPVAYDAHLK